MLHLRSGALLLTGLILAGPSLLVAQRRETRLPPSATPSNRVSEAPRSGANGSIEGFVTDTNLAPVRDAEVTVLRTSIRLHTGPGGRFRFVDVPSGPYLLIVRRIGFRPVSAVVEVPAGEALRVSYVLEPVQPATPLDTVRILETRRSLRMQEFESRRKQGMGEFLTQEQIDTQNKLLTADLLRFAKTINVSPNRMKGGAFPEYIAVSRREGGSLIGAGSGACPVQVFLDGVPLPQAFDLNLLPPPKDLAGVEVYAGAATVPGQFGGRDRRCGAILVWTRDLR